jgi:hypothetical protein
MVGAWILSNNVQSIGWNWSAIGAYNVGCRKLSESECRKRRARYERLVYAQLRGGPHVKASVERRDPPRIQVFDVKGDDDDV